MRKRRGGGAIGSPAGAIGNEVYVSTKPGQVSVWRPLTDPQFAAWAADARKENARG